LRGLRAAVSWIRSTDTKRQDITARNFPTAHEEAVAVKPASRYDGPESAYRLAFTDTQFLLREELRPVRMQLELLKPELLQAEQNIESTIVIFGSARILPPEQARQLMIEAEISGDASARRRAESALAMLRSAREKLEGGSNPYAAKPVAIMEKQVAALISKAKGQQDEALKLAKDAMDIELSLSAPSGPPDPIKPAPEFYGELLLDAGRTADAIAALDLSLQRTPNRTPSVKAMARARGAGTSMR